MILALRKSADVEVRQQQHCNDCIGHKLPVQLGLGPVRGSTPATKRRPRCSSRTTSLTVCYHSQNGHRARITAALACAGVRSCGAEHLL